jgi:hypothetical protein
MRQSKIQPKTGKKPAARAAHVQTTNGAAQVGAKPDSTNPAPTPPAAPEPRGLEISQNAYSLLVGAVRVMEGVRAGNDPEERARWLIYRTLAALLALVRLYGTPQGDAILAALRGFVKVADVDAYMPPTSSPVGRRDAEDLAMASIGLAKPEDPNELEALPLGNLLAMGFMTHDGDVVTSMCHQISDDLNALSLAVYGEHLKLSDEALTWGLWAAQKRAEAAGELHRRMVRALVQGEMAT